MPKKSKPRDDPQFTKELAWEDMRVPVFYNKTKAKYVIPEYRAPNPEYKDAPYEHSFLMFFNSIDDVEQIKKAFKPENYWPGEIR